MLQQTQVDRVIPFFESFLQAYPTPCRLADAPQGEVLARWQGLGYNRRALMLQRAARVVAARSDGAIPAEPGELRRLPGVGRYTAAAVGVFAFGRPEVLIETNIRTVFLRHFFPGVEGVGDDELSPLVAAAIDRSDPHRWYSALMDYGAMLKRSGAVDARRSAHHARQAPFAGSRRELRGVILRSLLAGPPRGAAELAGAIGRPEALVREILGDLEAEGFLRETGERYAVAGRPPGDSGREGR
jgi:A/G-specific adenine glycosylase